MPEKVSDDLHRHALIQKVLSCRMPQGVGSPLPGDDAESGQAVADDFAQNTPIEWPDRRAHREEHRAPKTRRPDFTNIAKKGVTDTS